MSWAPFDVPWTPFDEDTYFANIARSVEEEELLAMGLIGFWE